MSVTEGELMVLAARLAFAKTEDELRGNALAYARVLLAGESPDVMLAEFIIGVLTGRLDVMGFRLADVIGRRSEVS